MEKSRTCVKTDRNGTAYFEVVYSCDRCSGTGIYKWMSSMGLCGGTCFACGGSGRGPVRIEKEYTPEHQAKLDARAAAKQAAHLASPEYQVQLRIAAEAEAAAEAQRAAEEAAAEARAAAAAAKRAISQPQGAVGEKLSLDVVLEAVASVDGKFGATRMHRLRDDAGNLFVWWASGAGLLDGEGHQLPNGTRVRIQGVVKGHLCYAGEWQTTLTRVKQVSE